MDNRYPVKQALYDNDICYRCDEALLIPGLDNAKCPRCGWITNPMYILEGNKKTPRSSKRKGNVR